MVISTPRDPLTPNRRRISNVSGLREDRTLSVDIDIETKSPRKSSSTVPVIESINECVKEKHHNDEPGDM